MLYGSVSPNLCKPYVLFNSTGKSRFKVPPIFCPTAYLSWSDSGQWYELGSCLGVDFLGPGCSGPLSGLFGISLRSAHIAWHTESGLWADELSGLSIERRIPGDRAEFGPDPALGRCHTAALSQIILCILNHRVKISVIFLNSILSKKAEDLNV